jgi:hypothetical protein
VLLCKSREDSFPREPFRGLRFVWGQERRLRMLQHNLNFDEEEDAEGK